MEVDTRQRILDLARTTIQAHGYGGLSFRELAKAVGIKSSSIHYYFPTKGELGGAIAEHYTSTFAEYLETLLDEPMSSTRYLRKYIDVFRSTLLNENRMCLGGIMSAEYAELPSEVQLEVSKFSEMNARWIAKVLTRGTNSRPAKKAVENQALAIYAAVQGAQLVARGRNDVASYDRIIAVYQTSGLIP